MADEGAWRGAFWPTLATAPPGSEEGPLAFAVDKRKTLDAAQKFVQKGAFDKALKEYQKLLQADPKDTNVRLKIGDLHLKKGDQRLAIEAYLQVAEIFSGEGFDAKAVAIYKQVLRIDAQSVEVRVRLGDLYQRLGLPSDALREFQGAARAYQEKGQKREAFEMLKRVAQLDPTNVQNRLSLADLMLRESLRDEARAEMEGLLAEVERLQQTEGIERVATALLAQFPDVASGARALARVKLAQGQAKQAVEHLRRALPRHPEDIPLREVLVEALEATGQRDGVQTVWREVAELYKRRGDNERAREILQRYVPVEPLDDATTSPSLELRLEEAADIVGSPGSAPPSVVLTPDDTPPLTPAPTGASETDLLREARAQAQFGNVEEAERLARQALLVDVTSDAARALLAQIAAKREDFVEALRLQRERQALAQAGGDAEKMSEAEAAIRELEARTPAPPPRHPAAKPPKPVEPPKPAAPPPAVEALKPAAKGAKTFALPTKGGRVAPPVDELPDIELVLEDEESSVETPATPVLAPNADGEEIEINLDGDLSLDDEPPAKPAPAKAAPPRAAPPAPAPDPAPAAAASGSSKSWSAESTVIAERLEEAEFYLQQGMMDEAEALFRKLLERVPHHPQALVRMGEIEARRGKAEVLERPAVAAKRSLEDTAVETSDDVDAVPEIAFESAPAVAKPVVAPPPPPPPPAPAAVEIEIEVAPPPPPPPPPVVKPAPVVTPPLPVAPPPPPPPPVVVAPPAIDLGAELLAEDPDLVRPTLPEPEEEAGDFDLAAELSTEELAKNETTADAFDQVFRAFKKGIEAQIGPDECDAHYDLAIAYREMGLYDDAARELELVVKGGRALEGLTLLAQCKIELGLPEEAIAHVRSAQALPNLGAEAQLSLAYELGVALAAAGQREEALAKLREIAITDPAYRDVVDRVNELEKGGA